MWPGLSVLKDWDRLLILERYDKKHLYAVFFVIGVAMVGMGAMFSPPFLVKHFKPAGFHWQSTVLLIHSLRAMIIVVGIAVSVYSAACARDSTVTRKVVTAISREKVFFTVIYVALLLFAFPFFLYALRQMGSMRPIDYNEGWNVIHTWRLRHGQPLYPPLDGFPLIPVNYPPLSFLLIGMLDHLRGDLLFTGRWVALISFLVVGFTVFKIIEACTADRIAAGLGATFWLALLPRLAMHYVGMYDPQLLGHAFSTAALYFYAKWISKLSVQRVWLLALLCCFGLFIKHLLIVVPLALSITLLWTDRKRLVLFAISGVVTVSLMVWGSWALFGDAFFANLLIDINRGWSIARAAHNTWDLMVRRYGIVFSAAYGVVLLQSVGPWKSLLVYFPLSLIAGACVAAGFGVDVNGWFDFFIASSVVVGLLAAVARFHASRARVSAGGILVTCLLPFVVFFRADLNTVLDYGTLVQDDRAYLEDVRLLRSIPGPALFDDPQLGFAAGKPYLFDAFLGGRLIVSGVWPEHTLTDRIKAGYFDVIVLPFDLENTLTTVNGSEADRQRSPAVLTGRWTNTTLRTIADHYCLLNVNRPRYGFFYVPCGKRISPRVSPRPQDQMRHAFFKRHQRLFPCRSVARRLGADARVLRAASDAVLMPSAAAHLV